MGMPSFYGWLVNKYPKIVAAAASSGDGEAPEFDNLYLDMNGIIHPCFHPDDDLFPRTTFEQVFESMHEYIDHLVGIVKPRKLLFMAIDGVAPRAKMNQIRAGRYRSAKDAEIAEEIDQKLRKHFENKGKVFLPKEDSEISDSNVITPGTEFMHELSKNLRSYVNQRINENPLWGNIEVILSDDMAPGEGEHKITSFIRAQRASSDYDPNTRHCLYGHDADLIMLALATHEVHFSILREERLSPNSGHGNGTTSNAVKLRVWFKENPCLPSSGKSVIDTSEDHFPVSKRKAYQFLNVSVLREYLALDMEIPSFDKFEFDLERVIDDFIFICFFAGNDFLPHSPSLEIHEGCIDLLMDVYKKEIQNLGGYIVNMEKVDDKKGGYIKLSRVERFILAVGAYEERIFSKRSQIRDRIMSRILAEYGDAVKYGTPGWKERYYKEKFGAEDATEMEAKRKSSVAKYVEGLCWVLEYYFLGVPSWSWHYPYYYGPFASDFRGMSQLKVRFEKGLPFKPFDQLMAVLPPRSSGALPSAYRRLMVEENSPIIDFYPTEFHVDLDGKRFSWQGICELEFIDEERLLKATREAECLLKDEEKIRNEPTPDHLFLRRSSELRKQLLSCRERKNSETIKGAVAVESEIRGIKGTIHLMCENLSESDDYNSSDDKCIYYEIPECFQNIPRLLEGIDFPEKTIKRDDLGETVLWHEHHRNGTWQNNHAHRPHCQDPDTLLKGTGNGKGFSSGRGKVALPPQENQNHNRDGLFMPSYRMHDYRGSQGFQRPGPNYRGKLSYRPHDNDVWRSRADETEDWRVRQSFAPSTGGRGQGRGRG